MILPIIIMSCIMFSFILWMVGTMTESKFVIISSIILCIVSLSILSFSYGGFNTACTYQELIK